MTQKLKRHFLALLASLSLLTLLKTAWEEQKLFFNPKSTDPNSKDSAAQTPQSHRHERIRVDTLAEKYLPNPHHRAPPHRRLVVVGDVHGCKAELVTLLNKISFRRDSDHLILAGDFVNKGPYSHGVVALARELDASCVRGNHEDKLLKALEAAGGRPLTDAKLARLAKELSKEDLVFIGDCPHLLSLGRVPGLPFRDTVVVHGGLEPNVPLQKQDAYAVMNMRAIDPRTGRPEADRDDGVAWWRVWNKAQRRLKEKDRMLVVYGHDSKQGLVEKEYSIGLDSGCVNGNRLSALVIDGMVKGGMKVVSVRSHVKD